MRHPVIAILLCVLATVAIAQTAAPTPRAASKHTATPSASARPSPELIKSAGAATHEQADTMQAPSHQQAGAGADDEGQPRSNGKAMLLAALAVMAGIALRRFTRDK